MSVRGFFGAVAAIAVMGLATEAVALPTFQLQIKSGTYNSGPIIGSTGTSGLVSATVPNINGGAGNRFTSNDLKVQGAFTYQNNILYLSLDVPDITHTNAAPGTIDFYLTLYNLTSPVGKNIDFKYDLSGTNAGLHVNGPDNSSEGWFYYSSANSHNVLSPGTAEVTTPAIASNFASTPTCQLAAPKSLSYSCEYIQPVTLVPLYSVTERIELKFAQNTKNKTARGQVSVQVPFFVPEPASVALLGAGLLAAAFSSRRRKNSAVG